VRKSCPLRASVRLGGVAVALAAMVVGCTGGGADKEDDGVVVTKPAVRVANAPEIGKIVVDAKGMPLYVNNVDTERKIACAGECTMTWRPFAVATAEVPLKLRGVNGSFGTTKRSNGTYQLTLTGHPVYTYSKEGTRGTAKGNGTTDTYQGKKFTWRVVTATGRVAPAGSASPSATPDR
jgi:predicted lipoprotein with Yx(FWY)xxD motif